MQESEQVMPEGDRGRQSTFQRQEGAAVRQQGVALLNSCSGLCFETQAPAAEALKEPHNSLRDNTKNAGRLPHSHCTLLKFP